MTPATIAVSNTGPFCVRCPLRRKRPRHRRRQTYARFRFGDPMGNGFGADVDHRGPGARIQMRQSRCCGCGVACDGSAPDVIHFDVLHASGAQFVAQFTVAIGAPLPHRAHQSQQLLVAGAAAQRRPQIGALGREQAGVELAVRGQPRARAVAAERLRDRGDEADLTAAVVERVAARDLAGIGRIERAAAASARACSSSSCCEGTTRSRFQSLRLPTSMYSMKRTMTPVPRKCSTRSSTVWSLTPRSTTALTLMGDRPARSRGGDAVEHVLDAAVSRRTCARTPPDPGCRGSR